MEQKYKIIALFGKSAAGKDTIQKWLVQHMNNAHEIIGCTTRPPAIMKMMVLIIIFYLLINLEKRY